MNVVTPSDAHPPGASRTSEDTSNMNDSASDNDQTVATSVTSAGEAIDQKPHDLPLDVQPSVSPMEHPLIQKAIHFCATATPETLGAVAVGIIGVAYLVLGRLALLLVGIVVGAAGFVSWEAKNPEVAKAVRGEKGIDLIERIWLEMKETRPDEEGKIDADDEEYQLKGFDDFRPETRDALGGLVDAVIRDYIKYWYSPIVPADHSFPLAIRKTLNSFLIGISNHLYRKRPADAFLDLLTNSASMVIVFMSELSTALSDLPPDSNTSAVNAVYGYLAENPDSRLASLLNQKQQAAKFKMVAEDLLVFLDRSSHDCDPARVFLREVIATCILELALQMCSRAEWINGWIVHLLEGGEPDLSQAIDVGMQSGREGGTTTFVDIDGNISNISMVKSGRSSTEVDRGRRKESMAHRKKLSKADEELEEAMEEMKRMNAMIRKDDERRRRDSLVQEPKTSSEESRPVSKQAPQTEARRSQTAPVQRHSRQKSSRDGESPLSTPDGFSSMSDAMGTPVTPQSMKNPSSQDSSPRKSQSSQFTSFDQIVPPAREQPEELAPRRPPLTLHNATFVLHDDTTNDSGKIRTKPSWDYLIQVEPGVIGHSGWMIVRRYADFETLHEILRRIAVVSGASAFTELHKELPAWKVHTRESLRGELERYLRDACWYQSLAESEGMKRFLEKSQGHTHTGKNFGWETVGKNMLDVLTIGPKGAMEGGKTLVDGVTGVFGNIPGLSRKSTTQSLEVNTDSKRLSISTPPQMESKSPARSERASIDSQRSSVISTQPGKVAPMERRPSFQSLMGLGDGDADSNGRGRMERNESFASTSASARPSREHSRASSLAPIRSPSTNSFDQMKLPPPPDEMPDDYALPNSPGGDNLTMHSLAHRSSASLGNMSTTPGIKKVKPTRQYSQLSEQETRVAVELIFAVINEMYTLSSAWNIRRTLLAAAKSYLLRPGNPSLLAVQKLMQSSVLDANVSDAGIAHLLRTLRENTMPTEQEKANWPAEMTKEEKEQLAIKARKLLIERGVPVALKGVMGQAATGEALGRVFDCLQVEEVARGLIFGLMLQTVRVITH